MISIAVLAFALSMPQGERVPESAVVNGVPQGMFVGRSLLSGKAVCLLFLGGGRVTRAIPEGGLENFDWNRHRAAHGPDTGTWQMRGGQLVVNWGDGGVHQGPITVHPDAIEFYGKRYSKPSSVNLAAIVGRWESARGTAITGGRGINRVSELVITADGRYQWVSTIGGVVAGRAVADDRSMAGTVTVRGLTIIFKSDTGTTSSHTFLPAAGQPVTAFSVDSDMFTKAGPTPATIAPSPVSSPPPLNSYQGLAFTLPAGWTTSMVQGKFVAGPSNVTAENLVFIVLLGAEKTAVPLDDWLREKMAADAKGVKVLQAAPPTRGRSGSFDVVSAGRTVQDSRGAVVLQIFYAIGDGQQAGLAAVATGNQDALKAQMMNVQSLFQSLRFSAANGATSKPATPAPAAPAPVPPAGTGSGRTVTVSDLVGSWAHNDAAHRASGAGTGSSTMAYGDGYSFKADGTYTYNFSGMYNGVFLTESDSGMWGFEGGRLVIRGKRRGAKTYNIIQFQSAPDGSATLTILDAYYPLTDSNINVWGEKYVRKGK